MENQKISYIDRSTGALREEAVMGDSALRFAYQTALGRSLWGLLFGGRFLSSLMGCFYDSVFSRGAILSLIRIRGCRSWEAEKRLRLYPSFNDFFTRRLKPGCRPFDTASDVIASPCDGRLRVYPDLSREDAVPVKGAKRTLSDLARGTTLPERVAVAVFRLAPVDYHRYHFPCDCVQASPIRAIPGKYHSVNPIALVRVPDVYVENARQITSLHSDLIGAFEMIEVGAFGVGSIVQVSASGKHRKMEEKGYFKFGGSTVILVFPQNSIRFEEDLLAASQRNLEMLVRCGSGIARIL